MEAGELARHRQVHLTERLLHFVRDEAKEAGVAEHPPEQRLPPDAAHLEERLEGASPPAPARAEGPVLSPGEDPGNRTQVADGFRAEASRGTRAKVEERDLLERA